jgi:hypothetical protein
MDWLPFILQAASVFGVTLTAVGAFLGVLVSLRNGRLALAIAQRGTENARAISEVHITMNGRLEELLNARVALARAEGIAEARADPGANVVAAGKLLESAMTAKLSLDQAAQTLAVSPDEQSRPK